MSEPRLMVGLGEVLWDLLPSGKLLGGAPTNFAYMATVLGNRGIVASRVGNDELGHETRRAMKTLGLSTEHLQHDEAHRTGTARISLDDAGQAEFAIDKPVAWDFLEWTKGWQQLAAHADVVCYGSLAQRSPGSAATIEAFLRATPARALHICDANLRKPLPDRDTVCRSFDHADIVKLNEQEFVYASSLVRGGSDEIDTARRLLTEFDLQMVCITRGGRGSTLVTQFEVESHPGFSVPVADSIGAGDAFTACVAHYWRSQRTLREISEFANRLAAWITTQVGATPALTRSKLRELIDGDTVDGIAPCFSTT